MTRQIVNELRQLSEAPDSKATLEGVLKAAKEAQAQLATAKSAVYSWKDTMVPLKGKMDSPQLADLFRKQASANGKVADATHALDEFVDFLTLIVRHWS
jgi:hypothetical protein